MTLLRVKGHLTANKTALTKTASANKASVILNLRRRGLSGSGCQWEGDVFKVNSDASVASLCIKEDL